MPDVVARASSPLRRTQQSGVAPMNALEYLRIRLPACALCIALLPLPVLAQSDWRKSDSRDGSDAAAPASTVVRQSLDDAWWTGPMLAPSAATLPRGHFLVEPYLYDVHAEHSDSFGSLTYALYGLTDTVTVGLIPTFGFNVVGDGPNSSHVGFGDLTVQGQFRLTQFEEGGWTPTTSIALQETLPTGRYDRLGEQPGDGFGSGVYTTTLALYSQMYFWLPNGRILRTRFNVSEAFSSHANVEDVSVYGTATGFRGRAAPGRSFFVDSSWEYSLTRNWVLALDVTYRHDDNTRVAGYSAASADRATNPPRIELNSGTRTAFGFAPAIEYSWTPNLGVLFGVRVITGGHNTVTTVTPAVAINYVH